ncbi:hypothetical protein IWW50_002073 [Coemansia erecta]|nr:hypothetical protein GGF43_000967 [Coemansia sp. RSA 2618]KAJ2827058.1 hypothetical protein IWW50_002073 [Coemansia erecta]
MKLLSSGILAATVLVAAVAAEPGPGSGALAGRAGRDTISSINFNDILGMAGSDEVSDAQDDVASTTRGNGNDGNNNDNNDNSKDDAEATAPTRTTPNQSEASSKTPASESPSSSKDEPSASSKDEDSKDSDKSSTPESSTKHESSSSSSAEPSSTGVPCSDKGAKQCPAAGSNVFQVCEDGFWSDQTCSGSDVCGKDSKGEVACMSKDQATVSLESCSKKSQMRCDATDPTKYQACDGSHWQTYGCDSGSCSEDGDKVVCGSAETGDDGTISYTMHEPTPFVPLSAAPQVRAALGTVAAAFGVAAAMSFLGF